MTCSKGGGVPLLLHNSLHDLASRINEIRLYKIDLMTQ